MNASFDCEISLSKKLRSVVPGRATITLSVVVENGRGVGQLFIDGEVIEAGQLEIGSELTKRPIKST